VYVSLANAELEAIVFIVIVIVTPRLKDQPVRSVEIPDDRR
jgi:hypothetical protein